ncbi:hypothetical protein [Nocardia sp. NPDC050435]|uniref:hypothetical protein n=1 Tax=Nocardia sp. NPDC050435 TaxID=3155040 RepID=UPI0033E44FCB
MNTSTARFLLADKATWGKLDRQLVEFGTFDLGTCTATILERYVETIRADQSGYSPAHLVIRIDHRDGSDPDYFRKDGKYSHYFRSVYWEGEFYRVEPVEKTATTYERP